VSAVQLVGRRVVIDLDTENVRCAKCKRPYEPKQARDGAIVVRLNKHTGRLELRCARCAGGK
jgi:hypothetical protein